MQHGNFNVNRIVYRIAQTQRRHSTMKITILVASILSTASAFTTQRGELGMLLLVVVVKLNINVNFSLNYNSLTVDLVVAIISRTKLSIL